MKKTLLVLVLALAFNFSNAQQRTFKEVSESTTSRIRGKITSYVTSMGDTIKIGDKVQFGNPSNANNSFVYIFENTPLAAPTLAGIRAQGWNSEVLKIRIRGNKRQGYKAVFTSKTEMGFTRYLYDYETALSVGELVTDRLTRAEAIAKLKESKDLLDLGMVTQEEFSALKKELTPVIMGN
jgi:hypothetical protein